MSARTHISIRGDTYKEAKKLVEEMAALGRLLTMEEAVFEVKRKKREKQEKLQGWSI